MQTRRRSGGRRSPELRVSSVNQAAMLSRLNLSRAIFAMTPIISIFFQFAPCKRLIIPVWEQPVSSWTSADHVRSPFSAINQLATKPCEKISADGQCVLDPPDGCDELELFYCCNSVRDVVSVFTSMPWIKRRLPLTPWVLRIGSQYLQTLTMLWIINILWKETNVE